MATPSEWVVIARTAADFGLLANDPRWKALPPEPGFAAWTDDFSNVAGVVKW